MDDDDIITYPLIGPKGGALMDPNLECNCTASELMIFPCAGACSVGQLSNDLAKKMSKEGIGKMACIAAVGAGGPMAIKAANEAKIVLIIDGCPMSCAKKIVEKAGIRPTLQVLVTDIGMKKTDVLGYSDEEMEQAFRMTLDRLRNVPR